MAFLFNNDKSRVDLDTAIAPILAPLESAYQTNIDSVYTTLVNSGSTPADKSPSSINSAIDNIVTQIYQLLQSLGQTPASKKLADLKTAITGLTTKTWTAEYGGINSRATAIDCRNMQSLTNVGALSTSVDYLNSSGTIISSQSIPAGGTATFPSNANYVVMSNPTTAQIEVVYQTKILRGTN